MKEDITGIESQMKAGFAEVDKRFEQVDQRFEQDNQQFDKIADRFAKTPTREEMNKGFAEQRADSAALKRTLLNGAIAIIIVAIVTGSAAIVAALIGFVA
jgi:hypothetical protein